MRELLELLKNTDTLMLIEPCELGIEIAFAHFNTGNPKRFEFLLSDVDIADMWQVLDVEKYIILKLNCFLEQAGDQDMRVRNSLYCES